MEIISRKEALLLKQPYYFTGKSCKYGHVDKRHTTDRVCWSCHIAWRTQNREHCRYYSQKYRKEHPEKIKQYCETHKEQRVKSTLNWREQNPEKVKEIDKRYRQNNKKKINARNARRRAMRINATPTWSEKELIELFYENCPNNYHVDHIIPLINQVVCGLHVLSNLQYLPARENIQKGNQLSC